MIDYQFQILSTLHIFNYYSYYQNDIRLVLLYHTLYNLHTLMILKINNRLLIEDNDANCFEKYLTFGNATSYHVMLRQAPHYCLDNQ